MAIKDGTILQGCLVDFTDDFFGRTAQKVPGFYVFFGTWKGPFKTAKEAKQAYREWAWEAKHS